MKNLCDLNLTEAISLIRSVKLSPVEYLEALLTRARELEADLGVWVTIDEDDVMEAAKTSEMCLSSGGVIGPLHGIPFGIKDIIYTSGIKTTAGSPIYEEFVPDYDATVVRKLKKAGAIIMGKTVTTEFACMDPSKTRNPWNAKHTPGGSSSGSAVGVAARMFPGALGSQTAGSVIRPASYNGVVGFKPTFGRISRYGVFPVSESLDTMGFFVRKVQDAAVVLDVLSGYDHNDPFSSVTVEPDGEQRLYDTDVPPCIGLIGKLFKDKANPEVNRHTESVVKKFAAAGATVKELQVSIDFDAVLDAHRVIMSTEAAASHKVNFTARPNDYSPKVRELINKGLSTTADTYAQAISLGRNFQQGLEDVFKQVDVVLTPSTPSPAPGDLTTTGDPIFQASWTMSRLPTITLPSGLSKAGLPMGIQLVATKFDEAALLTAAAWCERVLDTNLVPPV